MADFTHPTVPMTKKAQKAAKELAVAYDAYSEARKASPRTDESDNSICVWARMLIGAQIATGVVMHDAVSLQYDIDRARERMAERALARPAYQYMQAAE